MLLRLAYLAATNTLSLLRLLPMSDRSLPEPISVPAQSRYLEVRRRDRLSGILHEYRRAA